MVRAKGNQSKQIKQPSVFGMATQERIQLLASIIVDKIIADTTPGQSESAEAEGKCDTNV